ncbi:glucose-6-phosphate isomerase (pgi) [Vairimorpha necatrix]|uniref:Glucose-6-phosphate isomerase n=1 Tax=Vairimorpha necatrix TaxID=6039 RepID=A0AAX4JC26_9MICR
MKDLFKQDKDRINNFTREIKIDDEFIYFDFSKTHVNLESKKDYIQKIEESKIYEKIQDMFSGKKINYTENREVLHTILRNKDVIQAVKSSEPSNLDKNKKLVYDELNKIKNFSNDLNSKKLLGCTGKVINTIVNIGIGGSDLGPKMVCDTLSEYSQGDLQVHFISNIDATATIKVFKDINPETSLFIICSKTFTTLETIQNMKLAYKYMEKSFNNHKKSDIFEKHFVAVSSNIEEVKKYNIQNIFAMWDFVGGRYSLWSAVGLSIACYIGFTNFLEMLEGASLVDEEFKTNKGCANVEIFHAAIECFYSDRDYNNKCIVSYDQYMEKFYLYLQQAEMESNGKYSSDTNTGLIIWGGIGTDTQHSFFQLCHQGTRKILLEFLFPFKPLHNELVHHEMLLSNCFAQSRALMEGKEGRKGIDDFEGNRPSISIGYSKLCPKILGALIAHYEHKIFVQGVLWKINSFDQFGVTLGKSIATDLLKSIKGESETSYDESTNELLRRFKSVKNE